VFHYHLPPDLEGRVQPGHLVMAPFGSQTVYGVALGFVPQPEVPQTKALLALVDEQVALTPHQLALAARLAETSLAPLAACIALMLPAGIAQQADTLYTLAGEPPGDATPLQKSLLAALDKRGPLRGRQLDRALPRRDWRPAAAALVRQGTLSAAPLLPPPRVRAKFIRTAQLSVPPEFVRAGLEGLGRGVARDRRQKILEFLAREPAPVDVTWVYAESGGNLADLKALAEKDLVLLREQEAWRDPLAGLAYDPAVPPALTPDQARAWETIRAALGAAGGGQTVPPILLHGVTGSGKTELYLRAVEETLRQGRQAIVLVPEIALTPQTVRRFLARFPGRVGLVHSGLSEGERYDTWRRARAGGLAVIVGPRSALFAPLPQPGLIVVDEEHDTSYYQDNLQPYYHARRAAMDYARLAGAVCLLGSATPDAETYYHARQGRIALLELPARILAHQDTVRDYRRRLGEAAARYQTAGEQAAAAGLPPVQVVDMRAELKAGHTGIFSRPLHAALADVLAKGQQAILFLNRRGAATYVFCRDCGQALKCPRCDNPLTLHGGAEKRAGALLCHHCGYTRQPPRTCPNCGSRRIRHYGMGTQRVEAEVQALFPQARTLRWDRETTRRKGSHDLILSHFTSQRADVLIGTQMLAKGLDLPLVTLVGAVLADVGLALPDPFAAERAFQVLAQVAGRAGRSPLGGQVILQTFLPEHPVLRHAAAHDYAGFMAQELENRRRLGYPPFARLVRLETRDASPAAAQRRAEDLAGQLRGWIARAQRAATELIGPAPCYYARLGGESRWQIVLRGPDPATLLAGRPLAGWRVETQPQSLL
jgi:primosomal protein N' (replication factor Y)